MFDAGVEGPLDGVLASIRAVVAGVEVGGLDAPVAARVVEQCAEGERLLAALRVLTTGTLQDKAFWRREGFRSAAAWMASKTGTAVGTAVAPLEMADQLGGPSGLLAAFPGGVFFGAPAGGY